MCTLHNTAIIHPRPPILGHPSSACVCAEARLPGHAQASTTSPEFRAPLSARQARRKLAHLRICGATWEAPGP